MSSSFIRRHEAAAAAVDALERDCHALWRAAEALLACPRADAAGRNGSRARVLELQLNVACRLKEGRDTVPSVVRGQAEVLLDRLQEGVLELDLAMTLGEDDGGPGRDALRRARSAVERDGRALVRALGSLADDVRGPLLAFRRAGAFEPIK